MSAEVVSLEDVVGWVTDLAASRARTLSAGDRQRMADVWYGSLQSLARHHVARAIRELSATEGRMPGLAEVLALAHRHHANAHQAQQGDTADRRCHVCRSAYYPAGFLAAMPGNDGQPTIVLRDRCACPEYGAPYLRIPNAHPNAVHPEVGFNRWNDPRVIAWNVGRGSMAA